MKLRQTDSSSFSDDDIENQRYDSDPLSNIYFRPLEPGDRDKIQELHEEWFPVQYKDEFYDDLVMQKMVNSGEELYTCAAVYKDPTCSDTGSIQDTTTTVSIWEQMTQGTNGQIVACIVGSIIETSRLSKETIDLLISDQSKYHRLFYIMTLGTVTDFRHLKLATKLVNQVIKRIEQDSECGTLYLHVITFNKAAIQFYEKLGFYRVTEMRDYYRIDEVNYNCYVYAKSFHGNQTQIDYFYLVSSFVTSIWNRVAGPFVKP